MGIVYKRTIVSIKEKNKNTTTNTYTRVWNSRAHSGAGGFEFEPGLHSQFFRDVGGSPHTEEGERREKKNPKTMQEKSSRRVTWAFCV